MKLKLFLLILISSAGCAMEKEHDPQAPTYQEWNAYKFHRATKKSLPLAKSLLKDFRLSYFSSVVDVGCGPGALTAYIAKHAPNAEVIGIDPSDNMIRFARLLNTKYRNLHFMQEDMSTISLTQPVQLFFSCNAFHLMNTVEQKKALHVMARLTDQNHGFLCMIMAAKSPNPDAFSRAYAKVLSKQQWQKLSAVNLDHYFQPHDAQTFAQLNKDTGFLIKTTRIIEEYILFKNEKKLKKFIASWMSGFGFIAALHPDERKQLLKDILQEYVKEMPPHNDGSILWKSPRFIVFAERLKN